MRMREIPDYEVSFHEKAPTKNPSPGRGLWENLDWNNQRL